MKFDPKDKVHDQKQKYKKKCLYNLKKSAEIE